jgi:hypothetical protein
MSYLHPTLTITADDNYIVYLDDDPAITRLRQVEARRWAEKYWSARTLGPKLLLKYEEELAR